MRINTRIFGEIDIDLRNANIEYLRKNTNNLYNLINNYGIAIIIFSVLLRIILIPITIKQQKTMQKSNKMQEQMKQIQIK